MENNGNIKNYGKYNGFEVIPRELLQACDTNTPYNKGLSLQAIGLLCNLQSYADTWEIHKTELYKRYAKNKERSIKRAWNELVENGYIIQFKIREGKKNSYIYMFNLVPFTEDDIKEAEKMVGGKAVTSFETNKDDLSLTFCRPQNEDLKMKTSKRQDKRIQSKENTNKDKTYELNEKNGHSIHSEHSNHVKQHTIKNEPINLYDYMEAVTTSEKIEVEEREIKEAIVEELPNALGDYLCNFSIENLKTVKKTLLIAKSNYNHNTVHPMYNLTLEDVEFEMIAMLKRVKRKLYEKQERLEDVQPYIMRSAINVLKRKALMIDEY
ncbi:hypothetical protein V760_02635 [Staphylococcus aureus F23613]|uniref:helix-turn-helix domain-containing protein n=1 Tax=Staphylococcus aureus TaxID=1280 RepID=UPI00044FA09A|nr:helix-turn-helix domain-containing protein [Staphylococcus aureus]EXQ67205.1 hypothetical protein V760_02635 [Staphylococcus aureus F23613]